MRLLLLFTILFSCICAQAQTDKERLNEIQEALDELQNSIGQSEEVEVRKIDEAIGELGRYKKERDSLLLQIDVLETDVLLLKAKLARCTSFDSQNLAGNGNGNISEGYSRVNVSIDGTKNTDEELLKGNYVVLESARELERAQKFITRFQDNNPQLKLIIAQNIRKTWYHICLEEPYTNTKVGSEVAKMRNLGYNDAWYIYFN